MDSGVSRMSKTRCEKCNRRGRSDLKQRRIGRREGDRKGGPEAPTIASMECT